MKKSTKRRLAKNPRQRPWTASEKHTIGWIEAQSRGEDRRYVHAELRDRARDIRASKGRDIASQKDRQVQRAYRLGLTKSLRSNPRVRPWTPREQHTVGWIQAQSRGEDPRAVRAELRDRARDIRASKGRDRESTEDRQLQRAYRLGLTQAMAKNPRVRPLTAKQQKFIQAARADTVQRKRESSSTPESRARIEKLYTDALRKSLKSGDRSPAQVEHRQFLRAYHTGLTYKPNVKKSTKRKLARKAARRTRDVSRVEQIRARYGR